MGEKSVQQPYLLPIKLLSTGSSSLCSCWVTLLKFKCLNVINS
jgi:hypothetical protein